MNWNADHLCPRLLHFDEVFSAPVPLRLEFIGIRDGQAPEENRIPLRIDIRYGRTRSGSLLEPAGYRLHLTIPSQLFLLSLRIMQCSTENASPSS